MELRGLFGTCSMAELVGITCNYGPKTEFGIRQLIIETNCNKSIIANVLLDRSTELHNVKMLEDFGFKRIQEYEGNSFDNYDNPLKVATYLLNIDTDEKRETFLDKLKSGTNPLAY